MKLLIALGSAAILTAACSASATMTGAGYGSTKSASAVRAASGANAGSDVQGVNDVNRTNPLVGKAGTHPVAPVQPQGVAQAAPGQSFGGQDRCTVGIGTQTGNAPRSGSAGKHPPLPMCAAQ